MTALPLPNARTQFIDADGAPIVGGQVFTYVPGTTTPKSTWQNSGQTILNTNPIDLDDLGSAAIWAVGAIRQVVYDNLGNLIWDLDTSNALGSVADIDLSNVDPAEGRAALGALAKAGDTMTGTLGLYGVSQSGNCNVPGTFAGDGSASKFADYRVLQGLSSTQNEIATYVDFTNGIGVGGGKLYTVAHAPFMTSQAGACTGYGSNPVYRSYGPPGTGQEVNADNFGADSGDGLSENSIYGAYVWNVVATYVGAGSKRHLAGCLITAPPAYPKILNRGIMIGPEDAIRLHAIEDGTNADTSYRIGGTHSVGIDFTPGTFSTNRVLKMNAGNFFSWVISGTPQDVLGVDGSSRLQVGYGTASILAGSSLLAGADNAFTCGGSGARWSVVWAATGTINTSDQRLKTDFREVPACVEELFAEIAPDVKQFRWKVGGKVEEEYEEERDVVAVDENGDEIWDDVPVFNNDGSPCMVQPVYPKSGKPLPDLSDPDAKPYLDGQGNPIINPETGEPIINPETCRRQAPFQKRIPTKRIERKTVTLKRLVDRPGVRSHVGPIISDAFRSKIDAYFEGGDFGGLVLDDDGYWGWRADQFVALAISAIGTLTERVKKLEAEANGT